VLQRRNERELDALTGEIGLREVCKRGLQSSAGQIDFGVPDLTVRVCGDLGVAWGTVLS